HLMDGVTKNLELNGTFGHLQRKVKQIKEKAKIDPQLENEALLFLLRDVEELDNELEKGIIKHCEKGIENFRNNYHVSIRVHCWPDSTNSNRASST
ncbi:MAG: hypothetical protein Q9204_003394, partial [Flavoplaca sp. TL-2023a]